MPNNLLGENVLNKTKSRINKYHTIQFFNNLTHEKITCEIEMALREYSIIVGLVIISVSVPVTTEVTPLVFAILALRGVEC